MKDKKVIIYIVLCIVIVCMMTGLVYAKVNYKGNTVQTEQEQPTPQVPKNHKKEILALIDIITVNDALEPIYNGQTYNLENINHKYVLRSTLNSIDNDKTLTNDELRSNSTRLKQCINAG